MDIVTGTPPSRAESIGKMTREAQEEEAENQCISVNESNMRCDLPHNHAGPHQNHKAQMAWNRKVTTGS
jgi:hypothetical protein